MTLYEKIITRNPSGLDENEKILSAYDKILMNEGYGTDEAKAIREFIKKEFKLTSRDVSVKTRRGGAIDVKAKTVKALPYLKKIKNKAENYEHIQRDQATGDILRGGNLFVFTGVDWKFRDKLVKKIEAEISKKITDEFMYGEGGGNAIKVYGNYEVIKSRQKEDEYWIGHPKKVSAGPFSRSIMGAADSLISLMIDLEDIKNLKKLG